MTNEDTEALEKQILQWIKNRHVKEISVLQYMREHNLDENLKEKNKLLGALKDFQRLKRDYVKKEKTCCLMLHIV
ncbi:hypothetical protein ACJQ40_001930 [Enterococcus faecium]|nr:hypothetical protein [Enterococcus faecium]